MENPAPADMEAMNMEEPKPASMMAMEEPPKEDPKPADENSPMMDGMGAAAAGAAADALGLNAFGGGDDGSDKTVQRTPVRTDCCCCLCNCSNELTAGVKCCFCFPIKTGIVIIGLIVFFISAV